MTADSDITEYYDSGIEETRLSRDVFQLERARTQEIVTRYMPEEPLRVLDVGGGAGFYSFWLAGLGHEVHMIDPVPSNIEAARDHAGDSDTRLASIAVGESRDLNFPDRFFDAVLLFGPLYHLTERSHRLRALVEGRRVTKEGGVLFCAAISRYASLLDGYARGYVDDPAFASIMHKDLENGQHRNPTERREYFTTAYFHRPSELQEEIGEAQLALDALLPVESFGAVIGDFDRKWKEEKFRDLLLRTIRRVENVPELLGMTAHLIAVAKRGGASSG